MSADLLVAFLRGRALQQVHPLQNGVFAELVLDVQDGVLKPFLPVARRVLTMESERGVTAWVTKLDGRMK